MNILILGGGISGLTAAWQLERQIPNARITLLEAEGRLGGMIKTVQRGKFLFEQGPRTFKATRSPYLLQLIRELGLENELLFSNPRASKRYLWYRNSLRSLGATLLPHLWRLGLEPFIAKGTQEETVHAFAVRRFGKKIAELLFDPLVLGIYAGDSRTLSCRTCFPTLVEWEQFFGSVILGALRNPKPKERFPGSLFTLRRGMESLIDALKSALSCKIHLNTAALSLKQQGTRWVVHTQGQIYETDLLFSTVGAPALSRLLSDFPMIPHASLSVVNLGFSRYDFPYHGYGYLVPSSEKEPLLGMIWDSEVFSEQGRGRMTAMVRPGTDPKAVVFDALKRHLKWSAMPDILESHTMHQVIPQSTLEGKWKQSSNFYLLGNYIDGVSVEHCIKNSLLCCKTIRNSI